MESDPFHFLRPFLEEVGSLTGQLQQGGGGGWGWEATSAPGREGEGMDGGGGGGLFGSSRSFHCSSAVNNINMSATHRKYPDCQKTNKKGAREIFLKNACKTKRAIAETTVGLSLLWPLKETYWQPIGTAQSFSTNFKFKSTSNAQNNALIAIVDTNDDCYSCLFKHTSLKINFQLSCKERLNEMQQNKMFIKLKAFMMYAMHIKNQNSSLRSRNASFFVPKIVIKPLQLTVSANQRNERKRTTRTKEHAISDIKQWQKGRKWQHILVSLLVTKRPSELVIWNTLYCSIFIPPHSPKWNDRFTKSVRIGHIRKTFFTYSTKADSQKKPNRITMLEIRNQSRFYQPERRKWSMCLAKA